MTLLSPLAALPMAGGFLALDNAETWVLVAFILFVALLFYLGAPGMIGNALDKRASDIRAQLNEARELREEAQRKLAEFERKHAEVERQASEIVERAKKEAELAAVEAKSSIEASVAQRLKSAEEQIAIAESDAVRKVRDTAVDAAIEATQAVLKGSISTGDHASLIDDAIKETSARIQ